MLEEVLQEQQPAPQLADDAIIDPEVQPALDRWYTERRETEKAMEFVNKHQDELKDPVLDGTVRRLIADKKANGELFDHEAILSEAKKLMEKQVRPQMKIAKTEGVEEGQEIARKKEQAGAIGEVGARDKVDPNKLSAEEFAKYNGLSYNE